jgi:HicB_like antitoxin of bacterial toxin-antitoxin system
MPTLAAGNTVYTAPMAKVMISIPDDLLERIDARASATRETRSGLLRRLAERELVEGNDNRRRELEDLLGPPVPMGGDAAKLIREDRESH